jgi:DNA-binding FrmR family transcriptional regulator
VEVGIPIGGILKTVAYPYSARKEEILARLRKIEGQVRGLQRMVEADSYCVDLLTQIAAVKRAMDQVALGLLDSHIKGCVRDAVAAGDADEKVEELVTVVERFLRARR